MKAITKTLGRKQEKWIIYHHQPIISYQELISIVPHLFNITSSLDESSGHGSDIRHFLYIHPEG
ncbi:hypothetical protein [Xanthovirga aplysinae]|uniref:hypothetical protein n=1 Tax=Xanthovirga aplysinae TaxID=2529853 RepID=UPI0012BD56D7|nr:hypothetical protein [Xanthovirga aplysinae]MTI30645.1 hypothetical protein [Xanthovirga aplysinae]